MEESQEKIIFYIVLFLIIIICLSIFIKSYDQSTIKEVSIDNTSYRTVINN